MRAVLDPNVLVSALISPTGPSAQILLELRAGAFELVTSPRLLGELHDVLSRDKFRRYVTEDEAAAFVELVRTESEVVDDPEPSTERLSADPDDDYLVDLARSVGVHALVSGDPHMLALSEEIPVRSPRAFLDGLIDA